MERRIEPRYRPILWCISVGSHRTAVPHSNVHEFEVNVFGAVAMTNAVLPSMRGRRRGHIIASMVGYIDMPHAVLACARLREGPLVSIRLI